MDIILNRPFTYKELIDFFKHALGERPFFVLYNGITTWDDHQGQKSIFQYMTNEDIKGNFKYGITVFNNDADYLRLLEGLSAAIAEAFECTVVCDASRLTLKSHNPHYSLLFEAGKVYLADDVHYATSGDIFKVIELRYELPDLEKMIAKTAVD